MNRLVPKLLRIAFGAALFLSPCLARATVTNIVWYRLGENDPGALPGGVATNTVDLVGGVNLPLKSNLQYSADVSPAAALRTGSWLSLQFTNGQWATNTVLSGIVNNFGLEVWVKPSTTATNSIIAYNGHTGTSGWGLMQVGTNYNVLFGGVTIFGNGLATTNVWKHLALVRDNGTSTLYVNGVAAGTHGATPNSPAGRFGLGAPPQNPTGDFLIGRLDEVRVFTFAPGQFSTNDLLLNLPVIPPSLVVTTLADGGPGSLRASIANALDGDEITFATNGTIYLSTELQLTNSLRIVGPGPTNISISAGGSNRVFNVNAGTTNIFSGLTIRDGVSATDFSGGGINNAGTLSVSNCILSFNSGAKGANGTPGGFPTPPSTPGGTGRHGAGIANIGTLNLSACTFHDNIGGPGGSGAAAGYFGGFGSAGGRGGHGGALFNTGMAVLTGCTFYQNSGGHGGWGGAGFEFIPGFRFNGGAGGPGGSYGVIYNTGVMTLTLCTVDGNRVGPGGLGDAGFGDLAASGSEPSIYNSGTITFIASTITRNIGGGVHNTWFATARNSIFALNAGPTCFDYYGPFSSQGYNFIGNNSNSFGFFPNANNDLVGVPGATLDPLLGPLSDNGGLTLTVPLLGGSPAFNAGDNFLTSLNILTDQRGQLRQIGGRVDIGSYEIVVGTAPTLTAPGLGTNQMFGFAFTNVPRATFTILTTTNLALPLSAWEVVGRPTETLAGQFQFLSVPQTNEPQRFYRVRSP